MAGSGHSEAITMSGGGLYSLTTIGAKHVIDTATPVTAWITSTPLKYLIVDIGASISQTIKQSNSVEAAGPESHEEILRLPLR
ncbi:MAG: hypothetical protein GY815_11175 [Gammaproteobacteria bacterium]|nr:hypothetical protein [Gammaproteobacteria bacterium]